MTAGQVSATQSMFFSFSKNDDVAKNKSHKVSVHHACESCHQCYLNPVL